MEEINQDAEGTAHQDLTAEPEAHPEPQGVDDGETPRVDAASSASSSGSSAVLVEPLDLVGLGDVRGNAANRIPGRDALFVSSRTVLPVASYGAFVPVQDGGAQLVVSGGGGDSNTLLARSIDPNAPTLTPGNLNLGAGGSPLRVGQLEEDRIARTPTNATIDPELAV